MRAISRFVSFSRAGFSSAPVADWKRRLKSSCRVSDSFCSSSSSVRSRRSLALVKELRLPCNDLRLHRQLPPGQPQRLACQRLGNTRELEHDPAGLDDRDPVLGRTLPGAHARLGGLRGHGLVRKDVDPDLPAALDLARHRDSGGLDLAIRQPGVVERLEAEVTELDGRLPLRGAGTAAALDLPELRLL